ncbi:MAG: hypothetical protein ACP5OZ_00540 [Candidatus Woesearchaeota archaeon]
MILKNKKLIFIVMLAFLFLAGCSESKDKLGTGIVRTCSFTMGEERCGKCYCMETEERGCEIIDYSDVGI